MTREEDVDCAIEAGADAVGFICGFPESPRNLSLPRAGELMSRVPPFVGRVLVTRGEVLASAMDRVAKARPSAIQLYGAIDEPAKVKAGTSARLILPHLMDGKPFKGVDVSGFDAILSDTYKEGRHGGTGVVSDWSACRSLREEVAPMPFILSGGLNPENVADAISRVEPYAVDVSSGVESSPGVKDAEKVREFVARAGGAL